MPQLRPVEIISTWREKGVKSYLLRIRGLARGTSLPPPDKVLATRDSDDWFEEALNWAFTEGEKIGRQKRIDEERSERERERAGEGAKAMAAAAGKKGGGK
jgi:hypothetical protein